MVRHAVIRYQGWAAALLIAGLCLAGGWAIASSVSLPQGDEFNVLRFELRHAPDKWLYLTGRIFRGGLSPDEEDARLGRYLLLTAQIDDLSRDSPKDQLDRLREQRQQIENEVEAIIEGRLTAVLEDEDVESSLPLFPDARWVFPPVDIELDATPRVLIVSPRERIELIEQQPMRPGLTAAEIEAIESEIEGAGSLSALVDDLAGMATYPAVVRPRSSYELLVETVAHEWVHNYLAFKPLGIRYLDSVELRTLNETVADIAGRELAALVVERYPLRPDVTAQIEELRPSRPPDAYIDAVLHELRLDVDALLAAGRIDEAEALMEQRRQELAERGVRYRRINQAFFAFRALYATEPGSIDPLGEKLQTLRARAGSAGAFLREAAELTDAADLERLLAEPTAAGGTGRR